MGISKAVYAASFDPFTYEHLLVIEKAIKVFDSITILNVPDPEKDRIYNWPGMFVAIRSCLKRLYPKNNWFVDTTDTTAVEYCKSHGVTHFVRKMDRSTNYIDESKIIANNHQLYPEMETIYFLIDSGGIVEDLDKSSLLSNHAVPKEVYNLMKYGLVKVRWFNVYWKDGRVETIYGADINDAFCRSGHEDVLVDSFIKYIETDCPDGDYPQAW